MLTCCCPYAGPVTKQLGAGRSKRMDLLRLPRASHFCVPDRQAYLPHYRVSNVACHLSNFAWLRRRRIHSRIWCLTLLIEIPRLRFSSCLSLLIMWLHPSLDDRGINLDHPFLIPKRPKSRKRCTGKEMLATDMRFVRGRLRQQGHEYLGTQRVLRSC